jgi:hypothetical protein
MRTRVIRNPRIAPTSVNTVVAGIPVRIDTVAHAKLLRFENDVTGVREFDVHVWLGAAKGSDVGLPETPMYAWLTTSPPRAGEARDRNMVQC